MYIGCNYSGQVLSYQKMLGQLQGISLEEFLLTPPEELF